MTFFVELSAGMAARMIEIGLERIVERHGNYLGDSIERLKDGSLGIFVFGPQGVGKTTLMNVLSGDSSINDIPPEYQSSSVNAKSTFGGMFILKYLLVQGSHHLHQFIGQIYIWKWQNTKE